jgi:AraC-like DNA-binding protein
MAMLVGQSTRPVVIRATGRVDLVGIRLQPWAARRLLRLPASELRDLLLPLSDVPTVERLDAFALPDMLASAETPKRRLAVLSRVLQPALESNAARNTGARRESVPRNRVKQVVQLVVEGGSRTTIREIAAHTGYSMRAIQRMFDDDVGLAPKTLMRIARVQRALRIARESPHLPWASIGARAGYFDQSHLVRDFRELVGCAPSQFRAPGDSLTHALLERSDEDGKDMAEGR